MLFKTVLEMWLTEKKAYIKESTYAHYSFIIQTYIIPALGEIIIENITEDYIQNAVLYWQKIGMPNGHSLKKSTVQNIVMIIKQALKYAAKKNFIKEFTLKINFVSKSERHILQVFSREEQNHIIFSILHDLNYKTFGILLCINSGLRIGELCALKWKDIDTDKQIIHITKTLQRIYLKNAIPKTRILLTDPKNESSIREIPLSDKLLPIILNFKDRKNDGYILSNTDKYMEPRTLRRFYMNFLEKNQINALHFHCLRHTFATRCIENGADYKSLSEILGHTTINMTLNMYVHPTMEEKKKCVNKIPWI